MSAPSANNGHAVATPNGGSANTARASLHASARHDDIPQELRALPQWVAWKTVVRDGKPAKIPINPHTGRKARTNDAATWGTFGQALARACRDRLAGVGFVFTSDDPYFGGDLDKCLDPATGRLHPRASDILATFATYAEVSPSGTGVKFIGGGKLPGDSETQRHKKTYPDGFAVELYDAGRFFALTGHVWGDHPKAVTDCQAVLTDLYDALFGEDIRKAKAAAEVARKAIGATNDDDAEVVRSHEAMIGDDFTRLYRDGDISGCDNDRSRADFRLAKQFIWRVGPDPTRVEGLMRGSALAREKWDRNAGAGVTYLRRTIAKAIARTTKYYTPRPRSPFKLRGTGASPPVGGDGAAEPPAATGGYQFRPITSAEFDAGDYELRWLVKRLLVVGQPLVIGGPTKTLKTNITVDLALSLGLGLPYLGFFDVYRPARVALVSGETGEHPLRETARNVARAKGVRLADADDMVRWDFELPQLGNPSHVAEVSRGLKQFEIEVLILDPAYLCLLSGGTVRAENVFEMGALLRGIAQACRQAGTMLCLLHHSNRRIEKFKPMELSDLAFSGLPEFARQWILLNHREPFKPETGSGRLWLSAGGSAGQGGLWAVDTEEGKPNDNLTGRTWNVTVSPAGDVRLHDAEAKRRTATVGKVRQYQDDETEVLRTLDQKEREAKERHEREGGATDFIWHGLGVASLIAHCPVTKGRIGQAITRLVDQRVIRNIRVNVGIGSGATREVAGVQRIPDEEEV
jgi:hypothetical protein